VSRRILLLLVAALTLPALALAADTDPKKRIDPADQRKAVSIVLKRSDFAAGWKLLPSTPDSDESLNCPGFNPNESDLTLTGEKEAEFERQGGIPSVLSFASVYTSKSDALKSWTRTVKPALARCIGHVFKEAITEEGAQVTIAAQGRIAFPKLAPRTAAFRVVANVKVVEAGQTTTVPFTLHLVALGNGRGDAGPLTIALGKGIPDAVLRAFAKLLAGRLAAAKL